MIWAEMLGSRAWWEVRREGKRRHEGGGSTYIVGVGKAWEGVLLDGHGGRFLQILWPEDRWCSVEDNFEWFEDAVAVFKKRDTIREYGVDSLRGGPTKTICRVSTPIGKIGGIRPFG